MTPEELKQAAEEFRVIYKKVFNAEINNEEATIMTKGLLQLFGCLMEKGELQ